MALNILITGTGGYVGTSFQHYIEVKNCNMPLENQWHVTFVSVRNDNWKQMDFGKYDCILHAAGIVHRKEETGMEELYHSVNMVLTKELAEKAKRDGVGQFIFLSTMSVYGKVTGRISNNTEPAPRNYYGKSKLMAEQEITKLAEDGFKVAIVRPPMIYGKACTGNYALLEKMARKIPIFPKVKNERSMIYIENLCECLRRMIETGYEGIFCPQNEAYVNTSEMVAQIRRSYGKRPVLMPGFGWLIRILAGKVNLFAKVFGTLTYDKEMSQDAKLGAYNIIDFGEGINASKH